MIKILAASIVGLGVLHLIVLGIDATTYAAGWAGGALWTWEHWAPVAEQRRELVLSGFAFWSTIGSFAVPSIVLGWLIIWMDRRQIRLPMFVGISLAVWSVAAAVMMPPSGFPIAALVAAALAIWLWRSRAALTPPLVLDPPPQR